jgi:hypothetical protein
MQRLRASGAGRRFGLSRSVLALAFASALATACSTGSTEVSVGSTPTGPTTTAPVGTTTPTPTGPTASGPTAPIECVEPGTLEVPALANVFAAGIEELPHPAGGGGGVFPTCVLIPGGATALTIGSASGSASFAGSTDLASGPDGDTTGSYAGGAIEAAGVVSGIAASDRVGYVTGVFLGDAPPSSAPQALDFTADVDFSELAPELGQLFFIGDGQAADGTPQTFAVPEGATRLYLGIADAFAFVGPPGYWDDNLGGFTVEVRIN